MKPSNYMLQTTIAAATALLLMPGCPCSTVSAENPEQPNLAAEVKQIFRARCLECHGDTKKSADIHILEMESYVGAGNYVTPGSIDDSYLYDLIVSEDDSDRMPSAPRPSLTAAEIETVRKWIEAGATAFPADVQAPEDPGKDPALSNVIGTEYVLTQILDYLDRQPRDDRRYLRFFSSNHLLSSGVTAESLTEYRLALTKAINHLSWQPDIVQPVVVDPATETIFAIDIRDLGWHETPFSVVDGETVTDKAQFDLYDQVLLEYPYGLAFESSETWQRLWDVYLQPADLIRPIAYVRVDWFVSVATQSPLYEDMLQLPHQLDELEEMLGVDSDHNIHSHVAKRAGMTLSGVSRNNRVVERHPARWGAYWKSFDFETSRGQQNMFADPIDFHFAGGEMIWNLPNGLQGYLVTDTVGNRILEAPTSIVTDKFSTDRVVRNGLACIRCHDQGMKRFEDNIRPAFEKLPDASGINKLDVLKLYPNKHDMDELLDKDQSRFLQAVERALGSAPKREPLVAPSRDFLDNALTLSQVAAELGLKDASGLNMVFKLPQFTRLGLAGLAGGNVIRRDTWEDYFDQVVRHLGIGIPIAPVDGLNRRDHLSAGLANRLKISTNKRTNVFSPGDNMVITISNDTGVDMFIELIGTSSLGKKVKLTNGILPLPNGQKYRFPESGQISIKPQLGEEYITVFASPRTFEPGILLRGHGVSDRFIHDFYEYDRSGLQLKKNPSQLVKKTLKIETR